MITITQAALLAVKDIQKKQNNPKLGMRLGVSGGGCAGFSYKMDIEEVQKEGDTVIEKEGVLFYVDSKSVKFLEGLELDYYQTITQRGFTFKNPNAKSTCGCGTSFSMGE